MSDENDYNDLNPDEQNNNRNDSSNNDNQNIISSQEKLEKELLEIKQELTKTQELAKDYLDKLRYTLADYDNYRKQTDKQSELKIETAKAGFLSQFINIKDDFVRTVEIGINKKIDEKVLEGIKGILKNIELTLASEGLKTIDAIGEIFDPNKHEVISVTYDDKIPDNIIIKEIRRGYLFNNKVLRPSLVIISKTKNKNIDNTHNINNTSDKSEDGEN